MNCSKNRGYSKSWGPTIIFSEKKTLNVRITVHLDLHRPPLPWPCCSSVCLIYDLTLLTHWVSGNRTWLFPTYPGLDLKVSHLAACLAFWPCSKRVPNLWFDPQEWPSERSHQRCVTPKPTCVSSYKCTLISIDITIGHFIRKISGCFNFVLGITALRNHPSHYI